MMLHFFVPGAPRAKQSFHYAGRGSFTPARIKAWQADVGWEAQRAMRAQSLFDPTENNVVVALRFQLGSRRRIDLDNLSKAVLDGLNKIMWMDDQQVIGLYIRKIAPSTEPGVMVRIWMATQ